MKIKSHKIQNENGNVTVVALMILVILTLIGISASRTSNTDILVARNQIPYKQDFYLSEGGQNMEAIKVGRGDYPVADVENAGIMLGNSTGEIVPGKIYEYEISYKGYYPPPKGYSSLHFNRYDYEILTKGGDSKVKINARYYSVGPKID